MIKCSNYKCKFKTNCLTYDKNFFKNKDSYRLRDWVQQEQQGKYLTTQCEYYKNKEN